MIVSDEASFKRCSQRSVCPYCAHCIYHCTCKPPCVCVNVKIISIKLVFKKVKKRQEVQVIERAFKKIIIRGIYKNKNTHKNKYMACAMLMNRLNSKGFIVVYACMLLG